MHRPSLKSAIEWIALNDAPGDDDALDVEAVAGYVTTVMVADLFDVENTRVARRVVEYRKRLVRDGVL